MLLDIYNTNVVVVVLSKIKLSKNYDFKLLSDENLHEKEREGGSSVNTI